MSQLPAINLPQGVSTISEEDLDLADQSDFLQRLELGSMSKAVVKSGQIQNLHYFIAGNDPQELSAELDVLVITSQFVATEFGAKGEPPVRITHDRTSEDAQDIMKGAKAKLDGYSWGFEFLLYVPDADKFLTFALTSWSARNEAREFQAFVGQAATLHSHFMAEAKNPYLVAKIKECDGAFDVPDADAIQDAVNKFFDIQEDEEEATGRES